MFGTNAVHSIRFKRLLQRATYRWNAQAKKPISVGRNLESINMNDVTKDKLKGAVVSGVQPTGTLHIGNYLGSIVNWVKLQEIDSEQPLFLFLADHHAFSNTIDLQEYKLKNQLVNEQTFDNFALLLACGINPEKCTFFVQSHVPQVAELMCIFSTAVPANWLNRMTQLKSKKNDSSSLSLMMYPILMAADILLYKGKYVPVGDDQIQHLEFAREIASRFNSLLNSTVFPLPIPITSNCPKLLNLTNADKKMSKSDPDNAGRIDLTDTPDEIRKKIFSAKTDAVSEVTDDSSRKEIVNLANILSGFTDVSSKKIINSRVGTKLKSFKQEVSDVVINTLEPIQKEHKRLLNDQKYIFECIEKGQNKAIKAACSTMAKLKEDLKF